MTVMQLKLYAEKVQKRAEERNLGSSALEVTHKRLTDVRRLSDQVGESLEDLTSKCEDSRGTFGELQVEMEMERYFAFCLLRCPASVSEAV